REGDRQIAGVPFAHPVAVLLSRVVDRGAVVRAVEDAVAVGVEPGRRPDREDAVAGAVLAEPRPGGDEASGAVRGEDGTVLRARREGVQRDVVALRRARAVEAPGEDAGVGAVLTVAVPGDDEAAAPVERDRGRVLVARRERVDLELGANRRSRRPE